MAQSMSRGGGRFVGGEYVVGKQIGAGSFSTVWLGRHRVHGTEVAIKEIVTARLNSKLQESLKSEIVILKKINHPNIICLHDMIEDSGKIYIILEYCRGGDLSVYIQQRQGRIPEATAKHFMQQLASGLKVLRENNLIHRDLKPQNLLLSTNDEKSILKIADFGFASYRYFTASIRPHSTAKPGVPLTSSVIFCMIMTASLRMAISREQISSLIITNSPWDHQLICECRNAICFIVFLFQDRIHGLSPSVKLQQLYLQILFP